MIDPLDMLTVAQVAQRLKCSSRRVRQMIHDGRLAGFRLAGTGNWRVRTRSIAELVCLEEDRGRSSRSLRRRASAALVRLGYQPAPESGPIQPCSARSPGSPAELNAGPRSGAGWYHNTPKSATGL